MFFGILFVFWLLFVKGQYDFSAAEAIAEKEGQGKETVVPAPNWCTAPEQRGATGRLWHPSTTSQPRHSVPTPNCDRDGAIGSGLALHSVLAYKQGQHQQVCQMRNQVDAWQRSDVYSAERAIQTQEPSQDTTVVFVESIWMEPRNDMERCGMAGGLLRRQGSEERPREHSQTQNPQGAESAERVHLQCSSSGTTVALQLHRRCIYGGSGRRRDGERELGPLGDGFEGVQRHCAGESSAHCGGALSADSYVQEFETGGGQNGQSTQEAERSAEGKGKSTCELAQVPGGLGAAMDPVRGEVCQRRSRLSRKSAKRGGEAAADQRGGGGQKECPRGVGQRGCGRDHRRRDDRQARLVGGHSNQHHQHGGESAIHPGEGDSRCTDARRVQEQETTAECRGREFESTRRWHWRRWLQVAVYGAFCTARQTDLKEVCLGLDHGSPAVLMNWSHSILEDKHYMSPWAASIGGLDLAWEVGTLSTSLKSSSRSSMSLRPKRSRTLGSRRVSSIASRRFFWLVFETSCSFARKVIEMKPPAENHELEVYIANITSVLGVSQNEEEDADMISLMATGHQGVPYEAFWPQNRGQPAVADDPAAVRQGEQDLVEVEVEVEESNSSSDSDSSEQRRAAMVYSVDIDPMPCRPRWSSYEKLHSDIAHHMRLSIHDLTLVHSVTTSPEDLRLARVHPFIAQKPQDITEGSTFQLVLLDVEFHNALPSLEPEKVRRVKLLPKTISRKALLAVLGLQQYCRYVRNVCFVWQNDRIIGAQQRTLLDIRHGDFIRIAVPPGRGALRGHYTREVAQCMRRGYLPSNIPAVLENYPDGFDVVDMPVIDHFNYVPRLEDLDYDRDAMALFQISGPCCPSFDPWPDFLSRPDTAEATACKVTEEDHVETEVHTVAIEPPAEGGRPELRFNDLAPFLHQLQFQWDTYAAAEREDEGRVLYVQTWYTDHTRARHCQAPRPVRLNAAAWEWPDAIAEAWDDLVDPDCST